MRFFNFFLPTQYKEFQGEQKKKNSKTPLIGILLFLVLLCVRHGVVCTVWLSPPSQLFNVEFAIHQIKKKNRNKAVQMIPSFGKPQQNEIMPKISTGMHTTVPMAKMIKITSHWSCVNPMCVIERRRESNIIIYLLFYGSCRW